VDLALVAARTPGFVGADLANLANEAALLDDELRKMFEASHARVHNTLGAKRGVLDALAKLLIEKEVVNREAFVQLLNQAAAG